MNKSFRILLFALVLIISTGAFSIFAFADDAQVPEFENIDYVKYAYAYNLESAQEIYEKDSDKKIAPASTVKLMTAIIAYEHYRESLDETVTIPKEAVNETVGTNIGLKEGEEVRVRQLLCALVCSGANDAANAFAYLISGSVEGYAELMNKKARELGAENTFYKNVSGIDQDGMYTTARDTALIAAYAYKLSEIREMSNVTRFVMDATNKRDTRIVHNRNYLLSTNIERKFYDPKASGLNSGYTVNGGFCTVSAAQEGGLTYVFVAMGGEKNPNGENPTFYAISDMIDSAFDTYGYVNVLDPGAMLWEMPVRLAKDVDYVIVAPQNKFEYILPKDADVSEIIKYELKLDEETLTAPIHEGQRAGVIDVIYNGNCIASVDVVTQNSVSASTGLRLLDYMRNIIKTPQVKITLIIFALLFVSYLFISYAAYSKRYSRKK